MSGKDGEPRRVRRLDRDDSYQWTWAFTWAIAAARPVTVSSYDAVGLATNCDEALGHEKAVLESPQKRATALGPRSRSYVQT